MQLTPVSRLFSSLLFSSLLSSPLLFWGVRRAACGVRRWIDSINGVVDEDRLYLHIDSTHTGIYIQVYCGTRYKYTVKKDVRCTMYKYIVYLYIVHRTKYVRGMVGRPHPDQEHPHPGAHADAPTDAPTH